MPDLSKKLRLPKIKIKRENLVLVGLLVIAFAIPLTVGLASVRQELRKRAAPATGSILINGGATTTNSRDVTLTLTAPTHQASLNSNQQPEFVVSSKVYAATCKEECQQKGYSNGYGPYTAANGCPSGYSLVTVDVGYGQVCCCSGGAATPTPTPTPTPTSTPTPTPVPGGESDECQFTAWQNQGCGDPCPSNKMYQTRSATSNSPDWCNDGYLYPVEKCAVDPTCGPTPTPTPPCTCGSWEDVQCGGWTCGDDAMHQHRTCTPAGCNTENRCPYDARCAGLSPTPAPEPERPTPTPVPLVEEVRVSNYANFSEAQTKPWPASASGWTIPWTLTKDNGEKTVYAKFHWSNESWTGIVSASITLGPAPTPTPTPTPTSTPTPTPTPVPGLGLGETGQAVCDSLQVGPCFIGSITPGNAWLRALVRGHDTARAPVAFRFELFKSDGSRLGGPSGIFTQKDRPVYWTHYSCVPEGDTTWYQGGHNYCELLLQAEGGGVTKACHLNDLIEGSYIVKAYVSSMEVNQFGDATVQGNWSTPCTANFSVYYQLFTHGYMKRCGTGIVCFDANGNPVSPIYDPIRGTYCPVEITKPVISNLNHNITGDTGQSGYANATVTFDTDVNAECRVYWDVWTGNNYGTGWQSSISTGISHSVALRPDTLWYSAGSPENYRYQAVCWGPEYRDVSLAMTFSDYKYFTLPSGGGVTAGAPPLGANEADLNGSGNIEIGDWGSLVDDYGQEGEDLPADFNGNGGVDILDVSQFIDAYRRYAK